jgi:VWFA-related protein
VNVALSAPNARRFQALLGLAALFALASWAALSQTAPSQPGAAKPVSARSGQAQSGQAQSAPQQSMPTLQLQAPLVVEDVVVLDSKNQPVHDLKAADFTITDDGKPVTPQSFEEHAAPTPAERAARWAAMPKFPDLGVNVFTNYTPTPPGSALNVLLLDALNTSMSDQAIVRNQMLKFATSLPPGVPVAIFGLTTHLYLLQGFTSDPAALKAAINSKAASPHYSPLLDNAVSDEPAEALLPIGASAGEAVNAVLFQSDVSADMMTARVEYTFQAFGEPARYLATLPGRKNLIWFSAAFPLDLVPALQDSASDRFNSSLSGSMRDTDDLLRRSQISIYPIDARGIFSDPAMDASSHSMESNNLTATQAEQAAQSSPYGAVLPSATRGGGFGQQAASEVSSFLSDTTNNHDTMNRMAEETGGKAFTGAGDFKAAALSAIALGSNYYTFSYTPPSGTWDRKYHKIGIKLNQRGMHLSYRRGYYGDDPDPAKAIRGKKRLLPSAMQVAMMHGAPEPSELLFDLRVVPDPLTTYLAGLGSHPNAKLMKPPFHTYRLDTLLDIHFVQMTRTPAGQYQGELNFSALVYNANGEVVNSKTRLASFNLTPDQYADLLTHGVAGSTSIDVPVDGTYSIRLGVHDPASNRVGAVEVPVAALRSKQAMIAAGARIGAADQ